MKKEAVSYFLNPVNSERLTETTMDYIYREISKEVSVGVESFSVKIEEDHSGQTILIDVGSIGDRNVRVEDMNGREIDSLIFDAIPPKRIMIKGKTGGDYFVLVKLSEDLPVRASPIEPKETGDYVVASSNYEEVFSENKINDLRDSYNSDYPALKQKFNIPDRTDFDFKLVFPETSPPKEDITTEGKIPESLEVFSTVRRVEVLTSEGETVFAELTIRLW